MGKAAKITSFYPNAEDQSGAKLALAELRQKGEIHVPENLQEILASILQKISEGEPISLVSSEQQYTTQEAADFLQVSRSFILKEIEQGKIPYIKIGGSHRRISSKDLIEYKNKFDKMRLDCLAEMVEIGQEIEND